MKIEIDYDLQLLTVNGQPFTFALFENFANPTQDQVFMRVTKEKGVATVHQIHVDKDLFDFIMTRDRK